MNGSLETSHEDDEMISSKGYTMTSMLFGKLRALRWLDEVIRLGSNSFSTRW